MKPNRLTLKDAPTVLNTNDKAMWLTGWNECVDVLDQAATTDWQALYRRMRNVAAGYSNHCDENGSTRKLEKEFEAIESEARAAPQQPTQDDEL